MNDRYHRHRGLAGGVLHLGRVVAPGETSDLHLPDDLAGHRSRASCRRCGRAGRLDEHLNGGDRLMRLLELLGVGAVEEAADLKLPRLLPGLVDRRRRRRLRAGRSRRVDELHGGTRLRRGLHVGAGCRLAAGLQLAGDLVDDALKFGPGRRWKTRRAIGRHQ